MLNALFVAGAAAAVTPQGLDVSADFFQRMFPFMMGLLLVFRVGIFFSGDRLNRGFGIVLLALYGLFLVTVFIHVLSKPANVAG